MKILVQVEIVIQNLPCPALPLSLILWKLEIKDNSIFLSCILGWPRTGYGAKDDHEVRVLLLPPLCAGTLSICYHTEFSGCWGWNPRMCACQVNTLPSYISIPQRLKILNMTKIWWYITSNNEILKIFLHGLKLTWMLAIMLMSSINKRFQLSQYVFKGQYIWKEETVLPLFIDIILMARKYRIIYKLFELIIKSTMGLNTRSLFLIICILLLKNYVSMCLSLCGYCV